MITTMLFLAAAASAAPVPHSKPYWLKTYSLAPYRETWTGGLEVKKLEAALPKLIGAVESGGARLTQPMTNFVGSATEQQLSFVVPLKKAKALRAALRKLGKLTDPSVRPHSTPTPLAEVREKLARLTKEKTENRVALGQTPAAAEAVDEMIEHLANVEAVARSTDGEVLWNLTVKEAR